MKKQAILPASKEVCLLISNFTINRLAIDLEERALNEIATLIAPYNQCMQVLLDENHQVWSDKPDYAVVWTYPDVLIKEYANLLENLSCNTDTLNHQIDEYGQALGRLSTRVKALFVPVWVDPNADRKLGILNFNTTYGPSYYLNKINLRLIESVQDKKNIFFMDTNQWLTLSHYSKNQSKLWYLGKVKFSDEVFRLAADDLYSAIASLKGPAKKLILLDLDNTLWGGEVGDMGYEKLRLGGHDPIGEAYRDVQKQLKQLKNRGFLLGIVSKNTEEIALNAIAAHPEMILKREDFVGWRINWKDKVENIIDLVSSLNLGLESVVFLDDNPYERERVKAALPDILVPSLPEDILLFPSFIANLRCFDLSALTDEDKSRTKLYHIEQGRERLRNESQTLEQYLQSLEMSVTCERLSPQNLIRTVQLLNKTNQMNLSTRRLTEADFSIWANKDQHEVYVFKVADKFGDYGLVGIASLNFEEDKAILVDFILSCRAFGKGVEELMLGTVLKRAKTKGVAKLSAEFIPTAKNKPCFEFLERFSHQKSGSTYSWFTDRTIMLPAHIKLNLILEDRHTPSPSSRT